MQILLGAQLSGSGAQLGDLRCHQTRHCRVARRAAAALTVPTHNRDSDGTQKLPDRSNQE